MPLRVYDGTSSVPSSHAALRYCGTMTSAATASCTVVATSPATSTLLSNSMQNNLCNRYIHRSYTACELSTTLQEHRGLSEHVLLYRRTLCLIRNCFQREDDTEFKTRQTSSEAHPAFYSTRTGHSFLGGKASKHEADHPAPSSGKVINTRSYTSTPLVACRNTGGTFRIL